MIYFDCTVLGVVSAEYPPNEENTRQQPRYLGEVKPTTCYCGGQHIQTFPQEVAFVSFYFEMSLALRFPVILEETVQNRDCPSSLPISHECSCDPNIRFLGKPIPPSAIP